MSAFEGQSDADIIAQQQASLDAKGTFQGKQKATAISDESNVTDAGLGEFETPRGVPQVSTGRTGQTGGGEKPQVCGHAVALGSRDTEHPGGRGRTRGHRIVVGDIRGPWRGQGGLAKANCGSSRHWQRSVRRRRVASAEIVRSLAQGRRPGRPIGAG